MFFLPRWRNPVYLSPIVEQDDCATRKHLQEINESYLIAIDLVAMLIRQGLGHWDGHRKSNDRYGNGVHVHKVEEAGVRIGRR